MTTAKKKTTKKKAGTSVAKKDQVKKDLANLPSYMQSEANAGNENVNQDDVSIPRITVLQDLSPQVKGSSKVKGAVPGMFYNTGTGEPAESLRCINLHYYRDYPVFLKRKHGGGFITSFTKQKEAEDYVANLDTPDKYEVVDTAHHFLLLLDDKNNVIGQADFPLASTKHKLSRAWNSRLLATDAPRFGTIWTLKTVEEQNPKGTYYNVTIMDSPEWAEEDLFNQAREAYNVVSRISAADLNKGRGGE